MALTDAAGAVVNDYQYDAYGRIVSSFEGVANPYTYTAREFDAESGLMYYRARYYDADTGRFISEDPIGFAGGDANLYRYVFNNPVNLNDPSGLEGSPHFPGGGDSIAGPESSKCEKKCTSILFGVDDAAAGLTWIVGQPTITKPRTSARGSSPGTSLASKGLSKAFPGKFKFRGKTKSVPAPTGANPKAKTAVIGRAAGRWVPIVGAGYLAYDYVNVVICMQKCSRDKNGECETSAK